MSLTRCADCLFVKDREGALECHRLPPEPRYGANPGAVAAGARQAEPERYIFWPQVAADDFCGEGEPRQPQRSAPKEDGSGEKKPKGGRKKKGKAEEGE